jgi:DNA adenine methylase
LKKNNFRVFGKTPISYYGGKQNLVSKILPLIPGHIIYTEAFLGGAAVFFAKKPSKVEVVNDLNTSLVTFYQVLSSDFGILRKLILETPASRKVHREAAFVLKYPEHHDRIKVAWALWVQTNMSFSSLILKGYAYDLSGSTTRKIDNKKIAFTSALKKRLDRVDIECNDAIKVIKSRDTPDTFHYIDPPYFNSNMGHYDGYTQDDFKNLLDTISECKGKFLLSSYDSDILSEYVEKFGWHQQKIEKKVAVSAKTNKIKIEVLTANYPI